MVSNQAIKAGRFCWFTGLWDRFKGHTIKLACDGVNRFGPPPQYENPFVLRPEIFPALPSAQKNPTLSVAPPKGRIEGPNGEAAR
jgi:hypothetical protein